MHRHRCWVPRVLIETLWNVNTQLKTTHTQQTRVLIETLWNVNIVPMLVIQAYMLCINRNIVECKYTLYRSVGGVHWY